MILIAGATGPLGAEICRLLAESGKPVRALIRDTSDAGKVTQLKDLGAEIMVGDLKDRPSLDEACRGVATVVSTVNSMLSRKEGDSIESVDDKGQQNLIEAAQSAGASHFILISVSAPPESSPFAAAKRAAEEALKQGGIAYTILRPANFMEIWLSPILGFDAANGQARIYGTGENKLSWISYKDVAKFVAAAVDNPAARNAVIKLGGPQALSPLEVISVFERVTGKQFSTEFVPEEALMAQKDSATDPYQQTFAGLMLVTAKGDDIDMSQTLSDFPMEMLSIEDYARSIG